MINATYRAQLTAGSYVEVLPSEFDPECPYTHCAAVVEQVDRNDALVEIKNGPAVWLPVRRLRTASLG